MAIFFSVLPAVLFAGVLLYEQISGPLEIVFLVLIAISAVAGFYSLYRVLADLIGNKVLMVEGIGQRRVQKRRDSEGRSRTDLYYGIGDMNFKVRRKAFDALESDVMYRAYYTPRADKLVNIETL